MTARARLTVPMAAALALTQLASAQDVAIGTPPFGTFESFGPTVLNVANLNTQVTIPVFSRPGRGGGLHYALAYDSTVWKPDLSTLSWQPRPQFGWHGIS